MVVVVREEVGIWSICSSYQGSHPVGKRGSMDLGKARVRSSEIVNDLELLSLEFVYLLIDICIPLRFQNALLRLHDGSNCWSFRNY